MSHHPDELGSPAGPLPIRETAPWRGRSIVFLLAPFASELAWVVLDMGMREVMEWGLEGEEARIGATRLAAPILCAPAGALPLNNRLLRNHLVILL